MEGFKIDVEKINDWTGSKVFIGVTEGAERDFGYWMTACEYFVHKTAQRSGAGYERALELLMKGAMKWNDLETEDGE